MRIGVSRSWNGRSSLKSLGSVSLKLAVRQRKEVTDNTLVYGVQVLNVERIVWKGHVLLEESREDGHPRVIAHEGGLEDY